MLSRLSVRFINGIYLDNYIDGECLVCLSSLEIETLLPEVGLKKKLVRLLKLVSYGFTGFSALSFM